MPWPVHLEKASCLVVASRSIDLLVGVIFKVLGRFSKAFLNLMSGPAFDGTAGHSLKDSCGAHQFIASELSPQWSCIKTGHGVFVAGGQNNDIRLKCEGGLQDWNQAAGIGATAPHV